MAKSVAVVAETGFGKSTSIAPIEQLGHIGLNPKETLIINIKGKPLPFRGWKKDYQLMTEFPKDLETGNYMNSSNYTEIKKVLKYFNEKRPDIKNVVLDDGQYLMADNYMKTALQKGFDKFNILAKNTYDVIDAGISMREDINFFFLTHQELVETQDYGTTYKMKTIGKMLDSKVTLEGLFTVVLYGKVDADPKSKEVTRQFVTNYDGQYPAKSPLGMFEDKYIKNDLGLVVQTMNAYYSGE